jgi:N-acetylmuramoyl-L-alanine amidase
MRCCGLLSVLLPALAAPLSAAVLPLPGGALCHPRPAAGDSLPRLATLDSLLVNGHLPPGAGLRVGGQVLPALPDGRFAGRVRFPADHVLRLDWQDGQGRPLSREIPLLEPKTASAAVPEWSTPIWIETGEHAVFSTAPGAGYWMFPPAGLSWRAEEARGRWLRLELAPGLGAWTSAERLSAWRPAAPGEETPLRRLGPRATLHEPQDGALRLSLPISGEGPPLWRGEVDPAGGRLRLILSRTVCVLDWVPLPADGRLLGLDWEPLPGDELALSLRVVPGIFHGHRIDWEAGRLRIELRPKPRRLDGARIFLDPGHGGAESGCIGASGLREADLNLQLALALAEGLRRAGAEVLLSREDDRRLGLYERVAMVDSLQPDLVLSLHHDSVGEREDPWSARGSSVFYWSPWAEDAARRLHQTGQKRLPFADRGLHWRSLALLRIESCPALLLEAGTLIHPLDEDLLQSERLRRRQVRAYVRALRDWFKG